MYQITMFCFLILFPGVSLAIGYAIGYGAVERRNKRIKERIDQKIAEGKPFTLADVDY